MEFIRKLPDSEELRRKFSLSAIEKDNRKSRIKEIQNILSGVDRRKILLIGPCSADNEVAILDYMLQLAEIQNHVKEKFVIVPRVYTSKPRTLGIGYKGLLHSPNPNTEMDNIYDGIMASRRMHLKVIRETGFYCADEMLYPEAIYYFEDLLGYIAVGARSVENQQHRLVSSGLDIPVGMKNPTSGDINVMLNAITASQNPQKLLFHGWECSSQGNKYTHAILRGYTDANGKSYPNYHYENICDLHDLYVMQNLDNMSVIVDCNHSNSRKMYNEQTRISKEIFKLCRNYKSINNFIKGIMVESYLADGCQMIGQGEYGKSITDPCLGIEKTAKLIYNLAGIL